MELSPKYYYISCSKERTKSQHSMVYIQIQHNSNIMQKKRYKLVNVIFSMFFFFAEFHLYSAASLYKLAEVVYSTLDIQKLSGKV